jgi:hypothetical protein
MFEQQLIELFVKYGPDSDGALERASLAELNATLSKWYCDSPAIQEKAPPPEPLPGDALRFPDFRKGMCRVLTSLSLSPEDKEALMVRLLTQPREPLRADLRDPRPRAGARSAGARHARPTIEDALEAQCWAPTAASADELAKHLSAMVKEASGQDVHELREKLVGATKSYSFSAMAAAKDVLHMANEYGVSALEVSKVYGEKAVEYSEMVLSSRKPASAGAASQLPQQPSSELPASAPPPPYDSEECFEDSLLATKGLPTLLGSQEKALSSSPPYQPQCHEAPKLPPHLRSAEAAPKLPPHLAAKAKAKTWRFDAGDGMHIDIRAAPDLDGERTGKWVNTGETFEVSRELRDADGVTFLQLADGRGWLFDSKPGVGVMCVPQ